MIQLPSLDDIRNLMRDEGQKIIEQHNGLSEWVTVKMLSSKSGVSEKTIRKLIREGEVQGQPRHKLTMVNRDSFYSWCSGENNL